MQGKRKKMRPRDRNGVRDFRHEETTRKNNPPAGIAPTYEVRERRTKQYAYDPHLDPQLQWAGKAEHASFEVDVVSLHIHERISTKAILKAVRRPEPPQLSLFGETPLPADQQIEFYQHEVGWTNRLILGDSLLVMNSLLVKEGMAGKVQMIYIDPPYGIKFASNFQPRIDRRDVKDRDEDLTHEPEQIKAYRDTWRLGIHSYLTYLRDRLLLCRELLHESGSIFVQINDENLHLVRCLLDEVFGRENFVAVIAFRKIQMPLGAKFIQGVSDYLLWYVKDKPQMKYYQLFLDKIAEGESVWGWVELPEGERRRLSSVEIHKHDLLPADARVFRLQRMKPAGFNPSCVFDVEFEGRVYGPPYGSSWVTNREGIIRLLKAERAMPTGNNLNYVQFYDDYTVMPLTNVWMDTGGPSEKLFAVQTAEKVVERCILMTTDPGDLVFDPTCVRKGTRVWVWTPLNPPVNGGTSPLSVDGGTSPLPVDKGTSPLPVDGEGWGGVLTPIENIQPGDFVLGHDGKPHRVLRTIRRPYRGTMVGIQHSASSQTLWVTADHRILCQKRTRSYGAKRSWRHIPQERFQRARDLRKEMTSAEQELWRILRGEQLGVKFRRQHPIGPYITDFYSCKAGLVIEVDGDSHFTPESQAYDRARDAYLNSLGLTVLHFTNQEISHQMEGVVEKIANILQQAEPADHPDRQWRRADSLQVGDVIYFGAEQHPVEITNLLYQESEEEVYDLEVEGVHSFLTEVCAVHNCGSGTTAYCAEKWGRRWITCDTSRVALAIARQRLMTAKFDYYELKDPKRGPASGFIYETVPHITLESIAKNTEIDEIASKYQPKIDEALSDLNQALGTDWKEWEVPREVPHPVWPKEAQEAYWRLWRIKQEASFPDAQEVNELLNRIYRETGHRWEDLKDVPEPIPAPDWNEKAKEALLRFWELKRAKRKEIDKSIRNNAPQEVLYDRPKVMRDVVRVSGPFTVEAIPVPAVEDPTQAPIPQFEEQEAQARIADRGGDYLTDMINLLKQQGGVLFPGGKRLELQNIRPLNLGYLHAEAETQQNGSVLRVAISFGPQHGPVIARQVQEAIPTARMNGYQVLIFAGFAFDPEAQALLQKIPVADLQVHFANIAPDVLVGDLLKTTRASQIFTVFGQPDVRVEPQEDGTYVVELRGVDIYDPLTGEVHSTRGEDVAAWFLDTDYDGMTFHICQAFFPGDSDAWDKLQRALRAQIDPEAFEQMRGTISFPFKPGEHQRIAVKVIDFRGNEVVRVVPLTNSSKG